MASINDRDAGRDAEGNGPSSFDRRDYRFSAADVVPLSAEKQIAVDAALAQIERAFGKWDRVAGRYIPHTAETARAA